MLSSRARYFLFLQFIGAVHCAATLGHSGNWHRVIKACFGLTRQVSGKRLNRRNGVQFPTCYRTNSTRRSVRDRLDTNSSRKVLKSSPWAHHLLTPSTSVIYAATLTSGSTPDFLGFSIPYFYELPRRKQNLDPIGIQIQLLDAVDRATFFFGDRVEVNLAIEFRR
jgi:hypothetical protein